MLRRSTVCRVIPPLTVISRHPSPAMADCELVCRDRTAIDVAKVQQEHSAYLELFRREVTLPPSGSNNKPQHVKLHTETITELPALKAFPDSIFVEDTCVFLPKQKAAVLTRPGAESRRGEVAEIKHAVARALGIRHAHDNMHPSHDKKHQHPEKHHHHRHGHADDSGVQRLFSIEELDKDAVVDGGDVLVVGDVVFVGRSTRTNGNGLRAIEKVAAPMGYKVVGVDVGTQFMHLKCAVSKLDEQTVFVNSQWLSPKIFSDAGLQVVELPSPDKEPDAANVLSFAHSVPAVGFNVVKTVVQDFIDAANEEGQRK